ncbi:MAG: hypothetical protein Q8O46_04240 [bacterium]|nr:hypothetical protein [bacterium]
MEEQLNALYAQKQKVLKERQQALAEAEAALVASEGRVASVQATAAEIVPPTMAGTVTPAQNVARGALEQQAQAQKEQIDNETRERENRLIEDLSWEIGEPLGKKIRQYLSISMGIETYIKVALREASSVEDFYQRFDGGIDKSFGLESKYVSAEQQRSEAQSIKDLFRKTVVKNSKIEEYFRSKTKKIS